MIKFFRKIRQNSIKDNKTTNYLKYALGEIVLVVIGILIALAINQKNTAENNNELRDLYITQLNEETNQNLKELIDFKDSAIQRLAELDTLINILTNKEYNNPKLLSKSKTLYSRETFNPTMITYENLKFSGDLKLFNDIELRNSISKTYNTFNFIKTLETIDLKVVDIYYEDYLLSNARFLNLNLSTDNFGKDAYFENTVLARIVSIRQLRDGYEDSIESLEKLKTIFAHLQKSK